MAGQERDDRRTVTAGRIGAARRRRGARWLYLSIGEGGGPGWPSTLGEARCIASASPQACRTETSGSGTYDTRTINKDITAVIGVTFRED